MGEVHVLERIKSRYAVQVWKITVPIGQAVNALETRDREILKKGVIIAALKSRRKAQ